MPILCTIWYIIYCTVLEDKLLTIPYYLAYNNKYFPPRYTNLATPLTTLNCHPYSAPAAL